jgi:FKBP-type peptidyl-prolyl cis-trans isomerase
MKNILLASLAALAVTACAPAGDQTGSAQKTVLEFDPNADLETLLEKQKEAIANVDVALKSKNALTAAVGARFLADNAALDGVVTTDSGLQYKVVQAGLENGAQAAPGQGIAANYHGFFIDGEVFDSSYTRGQPLTGRSNGFIKGWNEALGEMKVCEARTLYINSDLAYGSRDGRGIPGGSTLLFHMQLLAVSGPAAEGAVTECPEDKILAGPEAY